MFAPSVINGTIELRLLTDRECQQYYVDWLNDPMVNQHMETRWTPQTIESVMQFVEAMNASDHSCLWGIFTQTSHHIGNIKLGPINPKHLYADVSYFIGNRSYWGKGMATKAVEAACWMGFYHFQLHRISAGYYRSNSGSHHVLRKVGFQSEGCLRQKAKTLEGWEDVLTVGLLKEEMVEPPSTVIFSGNPP